MAILDRYHQVHWLRSSSITGQVLWVLQVLGDPCHATTCHDPRSSVPEGVVGFAQSLEKGMQIFVGCAAMVPAGIERIQSANLIWSEETIFFPSQRSNFRQGVCVLQLSNLIQEHLESASDLCQCKYHGVKEKPSAHTRPLIKH